MKSRWIVIYIVDDNLNRSVTFQGGAPIVTRLKDLLDKTIIQNILIVMTFIKATTEAINALGLRLKSVS